MRSRSNRASKELGVTELKANLSSSLRRVKAGGEVIITERGLPVAKIVPFTAAKPPEDEEARRDRLIKAGRLIPAKIKMPAWLLKPPTESPDDTRGGASVLAALIEERREGR